MAAVWLELLGWVTLLFYHLDPCKWCMYTLTQHPLWLNPEEEGEMRISGRLWCVWEKDLESAGVYWKSVLNVHWKDWCWSWSSNILATWCKELTHWKRPWCWERLKAGGEGYAENEMVGWLHQLDGREFEQAPWVGDRQGGLACCSPWGHKELDTTEWLNWLESLESCPVFMNSFDLIMSRW